MHFDIIISLLSGDLLSIVKTHFTCSERWLVFSCSSRRPFLTTVTCALERDDDGMVQIKMSGWVATLVWRIQWPVSGIWWRCQAPNLWQSSCCIFWNLFIQLSMSWHVGCHRACYTDKTPPVKGSQYWKFTTLLLPVLDLYSRPVSPQLQLTLIVF